MFFLVWSLRERAEWMSLRQLGQEIVIENEPAIVQRITLLSPINQGGRGACQSEQLWIMLGVGQQGELAPLFCPLLCHSF